MPDNEQQLDKFKEAAREHGADEDEARWDERLGKLTKVSNAKTDAAQKAAEGLIAKST